MRPYSNIFLRKHLTDFSCFKKKYVTQVIFLPISLGYPQTQGDQGNFRLDFTTVKNLLGMIFTFY